MKRPVLLGLGLLLAVLGALWLVGPPPGDRGPAPPEDLPWRVELPGDGSSRVLGLQLGEATLADAVARFGSPDGIALFQSDSRRSLEAYFASVRLANLDGRVVASLAATPEELDGFAVRAVGAERVGSGATRLALSAEDKAGLTGRRITGLSYLPKYKGLEAPFFRERLGEPAAWLEGEGGAVQWLYPEIGLSLLLTPSDGAVFEYVAPRDFTLPAGAVLSEP
jgi:hypothetical protein